MLLLSGRRDSIKKPLFFVLNKILHEERNGLYAAVFLNKLALFYIYKRELKFVRRILNYIRIFKSHYKQFTPELRFVYCVKRLFAYCFDKAPTLKLGFYINRPPTAFSIVSKILIVLTQGLKKEVILAIFCCANELKGGVVC